MSTAGDGVDVPAEVEIQRVKRVRTSVSHPRGVNWDDIELESDEDDYRPAKKGKTASKDAGQQRGNQTGVPLSSAHEYQLDLETAWALGFNAMALTEEEEDLLPSGSQESIYVEVRNHVLTRWREDVSRYLSVEQAEAGVKPDLRKYARVAWTFLNTAGYINFGVAPDIAAKALKTPATRGTVIIIGAGLAGLSAARQLRIFGFQVVVLEGHGRPGGRVYTKRLEADGHAAVADLGGSIITGIDGNPLAVLAAQRNIPMHDINTAGVPLYLEDGREADTRIDGRAEKEHNTLLDECDRFREDMGEITDNISLATALETIWASRREDGEEQNGKGNASSQAQLERRLLDWHFANLEFANAAPLSLLSLRTWDQDDPHEMQGAHTFLPGGNLRLVAALQEGLPIMYNSVVMEIRYSKNGVVVRTTAKQEFPGVAVLVTVPLGVLKAGSIKFDPPLPQRKLDSIQRMGFGVLNKVVMLFPHAFWRKADMFGRIAPSRECRGEFFLFYSYATISGGAVLAALVAGDAAVDFEKTASEESARRVLATLRGIFNPKGIHVPAPLQVVCTRWGADPMACGSYSSIAVGALGGEEYDILQQSVAGRLFFAGEATTKKHPATMHGAFLSGLREAANVSATLAKDSAEAAAAKAAAARAAANVNGAVVQRRAPTQDDAAVRRAALTAKVAQALKQVFHDPRRPPDVEFGCFAALYGPRGSAYEDQAVLRVDVGLGRTGRGKAMPIVVPMKRTDVARLRDAKGGDDARFSLLMGPMGGKLVSRGSPSENLALMQAVLAARGINIVEERAPAASCSLHAPPGEQQYHQQQGAHMSHLMHQRQQQQQQPLSNGMHLPNGSTQHPRQQPPPQPSRPPHATQSASQPSLNALLQQLAPHLNPRQQQQQSPQSASRAPHSANSPSQPGSFSGPFWQQGFAQQGSMPAQPAAGSWRPGTQSSGAPAVDAGSAMQPSYPAYGGSSAAAPSAAAAQMPARQVSASAVWQGPPHSYAAPSQYLSASQPLGESAPAWKKVEATWLCDTAAGAAEPSGAAHPVAPRRASNAPAVPLLDSAALARLTAMMTAQRSSSVQQGLAGNGMPENRTGQNGEP